MCNPLHHWHANQLLSPSVSFIFHLLLLAKKKKKDNICFLFDFFLIFFFRLFIFYQVERDSAAVGV